MDLWDILLVRGLTPRNPNIDLDAGIRVFLQPFLLMLWLYEPRRAPWVPIQSLLDYFEVSQLHHGCGYLKFCYWRNLIAFDDCGAGPTIFHLSGMPLLSSLEADAVESQ
jgi:hypothetical protein